MERVRVCPQADPVKVAALVRQRDRLDPFALARIDDQLAQVYALANHRRGLVPSTLGGAAARTKTAPAVAFEKYLKSGSGCAFLKRHFI